MMEGLGAGALRVACLVGIALAAAAMLRRRPAALRHWVLGVSLACAAALPAVQVALPTWGLPVPLPRPTLGSTLRLTSAALPRAADSAPAVLPAVSGPAAPFVRRADLLVATFWLGGTTLGLGGLLAGLWRLRRLRRRARAASGRCAIVAVEAARELGLRRPVRVLLGVHGALVVTWGVWRPVVLLPADAEDWSDDRLRVVLLHEIAHASRGDWVPQLLAAVLQCVYWFNPLLWIAARRLRQESEQACDDLVLRAGVPPADYAAHLLAVARAAVCRRHAWLPATAMAKPSTLEGRIRAMLNANLNRAPLGSTLRRSTAAGSIALTLAIATASPAYQPAAAKDEAAAADDSQDWLAYVRETQEALRRLSTETGGIPGEPPARQSGVAQAAPGSIAGFVYDELGGLLPGVTVSLTHVDSGGRYQALTDHAAAFAFRNLPEGDYQLRVALPGFNTLTTLVQVSRGETARRALTLSIGSVEETITVTAASPGSVASPEPEAPRRFPDYRRARNIPDPREAALRFDGGIGGNVRPPRKLFHVNPVYPPDLQAAGVAGVVILLGRITADGYMSDIRPVRAPHPGLAAAATDAVARWEFDPTRLNGVPVATDVTITVNFALR